MKDKTKATIALAALTGSLLSGCCKTSEKETSTNVEYPQAAIITEYKETFEPGTHYVQFYSSIPVNAPSNSEYYNYHHDVGDILSEDQFNTNGFINNNVPVIEGYKVFDVVPYNGDSYFDSKTYGYVYVFVNTEKVEVSMYYNPEFNITYYNEPGVVVKEHTLS